MVIHLNQDNLCGDCAAWFAEAAASQSADDMDDAGHPAIPPDQIVYPQRPLAAAAATVNIKPPPSEFADRRCWDWIGAVGKLGHDENILGTNG